MKTRSLVILTLVVVVIVAMILSTEGHLWHRGPQSMIATLQLPDEGPVRDQLDLFSTIAPQKFKLTWTAEIYTTESQKQEFQRDGQYIQVTADVEINPQLYIPSMVENYNDPHLTRYILPAFTLPEGDPGNYVMAQREFKSLLVAVNDRSLKAYKYLADPQRADPDVFPAIFTDQTVGPIPIALDQAGGQVVLTIAPLESIHIKR
ncbi:hypothetical protein ACFL0L_04250 [Patescibacteria group bacterium]